MGNINETSSRTQRASEGEVRVFLLSPSSSEHEVSGRGAEKSRGILIKRPAMADIGIVTPDLRMDNARGNIEVQDTRSKTKTNIGHQSNFRKEFRHESATGPTRTSSIKEQTRRELDSLRKRSSLYKQSKNGNR